MTLFTNNPTTDDVLPVTEFLRIDFVVVCSSWVELFAVTWFWFRWMGAQVGQFVFPARGMGTPVVPSHHLKFCRISKRHCRHFAQKTCPSCGKCVCVCHSLECKDDFTSSGYGKVW